MGEERPGKAYARTTPPGRKLAVSEAAVELRISASYFFLTPHYPVGLVSTGEAVQLAVVLLKGAFIASLIPALRPGWSLPICLSQRHVCQSADRSYIGTY